MKRNAIWAAPVCGAILLCAAGALASEPAAEAAVRSFEITYGFTVKDIPADAESIMAWIPVPPDNERQTLLDWSVDGDLDYEEVEDEEYGNTFLRFDLSEAERAADGTIPVSLTYSVGRRAYRPLEGQGDYADFDDSLIDRFLAADNLVPIGGKVADEALQTVGAETDRLTQARRLYDHIVDTVKYDKSGPAGTWGRGDAEFACDVRAGNCTDFHSLFIGEARSLGIPARFFIGMSVPNTAPAGEIGGYHCWAEFFHDDLGWVPLDASDASKKPDELREKLFGGLDYDRLEFAMGRDIKLPGSQGGPVNFIIYPYIEVDGVKHEAYDRKFAYADL